jgi:hypothetical protein
VSDKKLTIMYQLKLTPRETERLRKVSYGKQLEAGMKNPGSAGITIERFGDADPWTSKETGHTDVTEVKNLRPERAG